MTEEGDFPFHCDDTWKETPVRSEMGAADEACEGVSAQEERSY